LSRQRIYFDPIIVITLSDCMHDRRLLYIEARHIL
jgi:hypothetical protein